MLAHLPSWVAVSAEAVADISYSALFPAIAFTTVALVTVALRLYSRARFSRRVGAEDYLVIAALILSMTMTSIVGAETKIDSDRIKKPRSELMMKLVYAQSIAYHLAINLTKISILLQYRNIFCHQSRAIVWSCSILFLLVIGTAGWGVGGVVFLCQPVQSYWKGTVPGTCINAESHFWSTAILGIVLDWAIWALPLPVVGRLRMRGRQKMWLMGMFGLGAFICIVSVLRLAIVHDMAEKGEVTKAGTHALVWSTVEVNTAITCGSLLVMKPLFLRLIPNTFKDSQLMTTYGDTSDFCRVIANGESDRLEWRPWSWTSNGLTRHTLEQGSRDCIDGSSDNSDVQNIGAVKGVDVGIGLRRGDSCIEDGIQEPERVARRGKARVLG